MMPKEVIPILSDLVGQYYSPEDFQQLLETFEVKIDSSPILSGNWLPVIRELVTNIAHNNHHAFLRALVASLIRKAEQGVGNTKWEQREAHRNALYYLGEAEKKLEGGLLPDQISVEEDRHFSAKSEIRELFLSATTEIVIVDPFIGLGTLDCLIDTKVPIRILTGARPENIEDDFARHLKEFCKEGRSISIRKHHKLHDRYIFFNDRCWLVGSSLKDAGKKRLNCMEIVDEKTKIFEEIEKKWSEATTF